MTRRHAATLAFLMLLPLTGCGLFGEEGPVRIAAIGPLNPAASPAGGELTAGNAAMLNLVAQGLVTYDGEGQIDVGLAERWTVTADGLSFIFRLREAKWANGAAVRAADVAAILRGYLRPDSLHMLRRDFPEVDTIRAMTDQVIEIRLKVPQPDMLELLAQPSMAIVNRGRGWGPMRSFRSGTQFLLAPAPDPLAEDPEAAIAAADDPAASVELVGTTPEGAIARFENGFADAVIGGRFSTLPYFVGSKIGRARLIVDPVPGLFGLAFVRAEGFLASDANRDAVARVIRRQRVVDAFGLTEWQPQVALRPTLYVRDGGPVAVLPAWTDYDDASRLAQARRTVAAYRSGGRTIDPIRIAVPGSPGGRILFAYVAADLARLGIDSRRVTMSSAADLRLIDQAAPYDDPLWALRRLSCQADVICNRDAQQRIEEAALTADPTERARLIGEAEAILVRYTPFIAIASPLRWSVAAQRLDRFRANARAQHPLNQLMTGPR